MLSVRWTMILRELWHYRSRTALVALAVAVGVMAFGIMITAQIVVASNVEQTYLDSNPAHGALVVSDFGDDLLDTVRGMRGIRQAEARRAVSVKVVAGNQRWMTFEIQAVPDAKVPRIRRLVAGRGIAFPPERGDIVLERSVQYLFDAGDTLDIRMPNGKHHSLHVVGYANDLNEIPSHIIPVGYGYISLGTLDLLDEPQMYNQLYIVLDGNPADRGQVERAITKIRDRIDDEGYTVFSAVIPEVNENPLASSVNTALLLLGTLGMLCLGLSVFLVINMMSAVVQRQVRQIGVIKSLGGKRQHLIDVYLRMVLIFGVLALLISVPIAYGGAYFLSDYTVFQLDGDIERYWLPGRVLGLQVLSALAVPVAAALVPILNGARITIREAISDYGISQQADALMSRLGGLSGVAAMSLRNMTRRKARLALTIAALSLAGAMFIAVFNLRASMYRALTEIQSEWAYDVELDFARPQNTDSLARRLEEVDGVVSVEGWWLADARRLFGDGRQGGSFMLVGLPPDTEMARPSVREGRWLQSGDEHVIFVNADTFDLARPLAVGDNVTLDVGDEKQDWRLIGVSSRLFVPLAYISYDEMVDLVGVKGYANRFVVTAEQDDEAYQSALERRLLNKLEDLGIDVERSTTTTQNLTAAEARIGSVVMLLIVMACLIAVVGALGLASTMGINVMERTREIGILRSLGAKNGVIRRMVILESVATGLISLALGIALSGPLTILMGKALGMELFLRPLDFVFAPIGVLMWGTGIVALSILASLLPAQSAARLTIRDTLVYEG